MPGSVFFCPKFVLPNPSKISICVLEGHRGGPVNQQSMPFFESAEAATKHAIQASGKTVKQVASHLWPGKSVDAAQTRLANCLNDSREEKLTADEHASIAVFCNSFEFLHYLCHRLNHSQPVKQTPEDQAAQVQAAIVETAGQMKVLLGRFETLQNQQKLRAVA